MTDDSVTNGETRCRLESGRISIRLIRELAEGMKTQRRLASEYGVSQQTISDFKKRRAYDIEQVKKDLTDRFAGLWIADKQNRVAELQRDTERLERALDRVDEWQECDCQDVDCKAKKYDARGASTLIKQRRENMKAVAEELGQLPSRTVLQISNVDKVYHVVEGVDLSKIMGGGPPSDG